jgi:catabolite regulation protein CreA
MTVSFSLFAPEKVLQKSNSYIYKKIRKERKIEKKNLAVAVLLREDKSQVC